MIRVRGRYAGQRLELEEPLDLADGTEVEVEVHPVSTDSSANEHWHELGMSRLEEEWDNPEDAIYDDWRKLYGVQPG